MKFLKRILLFVTFSLCLCASAFAQSETQTESLKSAFEKLKSLNVVTAEAVGYAAQEGEFFKLSKSFLKYGNVAYYKMFLKEKSPVVRVMGLVCLAQTLSHDDFEKIAWSQSGDKEQVEYMRGCIILRATVEQIAKELVKYPDFFGRYTNAEKLSWQSNRKVND